MEFQTTKYFCPEGKEKERFSSFQNIDLTGQTIAVPVQEVAVIDQAIDPVFFLQKITPEAFTCGYRPFFLEESGLTEAVAGLGDGIIYMRNLAIPVSLQGQMLIPKELAPLKAQFQKAASYFVGLTGGLTSDITIVATVRRDLIHLPGSPPNSIFHCDYYNDKKRDHSQIPLICLSTTDIVGTRFEPTACFLDVLRFTKRGAKKRNLVTNIVDAKNLVTAPVGRWTASTDLHVHCAPLLQIEDVPEQERISWESQDCKSGEIVARGTACFRNFMHVAFERR